MNRDFPDTLKVTRGGVPPRAVRAGHRRLVHGGRRRLRDLPGVGAAGAALRGRGGRGRRPRGRCREPLGHGLALALDVDRRHTRPPRPAAARRRSPRAARPRPARQGVGGRHDSDAAQHQRSHQRGRALGDAHQRSAVADGCICPAMQLRTALTVGGHLTARDVGPALRCWTCCPAACVTASLWCRSPRRRIWPLRFGALTVRWGDDQRLLAKLLALRAVLKAYSAAGKQAAFIDVSVPDRRAGPAHPQVTVEGNASSYSLRVCGDKRGARHLTPQKGVSMLTARREGRPRGVPQQEFENRWKCGCFCELTGRASRILPSVQQSQGPLHGGRHTDEASTSTGGLGQA